MALTLTDTQLNDMAVKAIRNYKNFPAKMNVTDTQIATDYALAIELVKQNIRDSLSVNKNVVQQTQGSRSVTYRNNITIIDDFIVKLIGVPYVSFL